MSKPSPRPRLIDVVWPLTAVIATVQIALIAGPIGPRWVVLAPSVVGLFAAVAMAVSNRLRPRHRPPSFREVAEDLLESTQTMAYAASAEDFERMDSAISRLSQKVALARMAGSPGGDPLQDSQVFARPVLSPTAASLSRSGLFESTSSAEISLSTDLSSEAPSTDGDMIARLSPSDFRWIESSPAEQAFLGWPLDRLRGMSFLEIVHPDHRELARAQLRAAGEKGEAHGLIYRIRTARGEAKAIEMNIGVRYAADASVDHLRCHVADVTEKLRASRELRRRTKDLLAANGQLLRTNRELEELKDRYGDLYQNSPAMHFSLDRDGTIIECNQTLLATLGYARTELLGRPYTRLIPESRRASFLATFAEFLETGHVEVESRWRKKDGDWIDVWIRATAVRGPDGEIVHSRSIAEDVTVRKALESELHEKNLRLARLVEDLARKNQELDDFTHVVSHDLQEPLRTLIGFSTLLLEEHADGLGAQGREQATFLVGAARRLRDLVRDLLTLSRAGKAAGRFGPVDLASVVAQVRGDLLAAITAKRADVSVQERLPTAWGDRGRVTQLMANLVGNALKYTRPGERPRVEIRAEADGDGATTIRVRDHGIGIDPKHHQAVFEVFRRLHSVDEFEGTGAGLAICRKIVLAHGGRIWVESEIGRGATFCVHLPGPDHSEEAAALV